jgi:hypothetical protein
VDHALRQLQKSIGMAAVLDIEGRHEKQKQHCM